MKDVEIKITSEGKEFEELLKEYEQQCVVVGYQGGQKVYTDGKGEKVDMVDVVAFNEFGTSKIPARPFLANSVDMFEDEIDGFVKAKAKEAWANNDPPEAFLKKIGAFHVGLIQRAIIDGEYVPNAPYTIKKKGSSKPLIDTSQMMQSAHYIIRKDGE